MDGLELTWITFEAPHVAAESLLDSIPEGWNDAVFWDDGRAVTVGLGAAAVAEASGEGRWHELRHESAKIFRRLHDTSTHGLSPHLFGGLAFRAGGASAPPWQGFGDARFILPRWLYRAQSGRALVAVAAPSVEVRTRAGRRFLEREALRRLEFRTGRRSAGPATVAPPSAAAWRRAVREALGAINDGRLRKVVAARPFEVGFDGPPSTAAVLRALRSLQGGGEREVAGHGVRFALVRRHTTGTATFVGLTPERLVEVRGPKVRSEALAGTAGAGSDGSAELLDSAKDAHEHRLVVDEIVQRLRPLCSRLLHDTSPRLRLSAGVQHLLTPIEGELAASCHVLEAAERLHPTPAVCGLPAKRAEAWIRSHEPAERGWYSGPIGHFDADGNGELRVALRCALLTDEVPVESSHLALTARARHRAQVWAGAGLVAGSDPDRELAEVRLKAATLLNALDNAAKAPIPTESEPIHVPFTCLA